MVKGIGLGWGTPYMFRMAVRETGKVTYGVCLLDDNGEFSWNDAVMTASASRRTSGFSTPAHLTYDRWRLLRERAAQRTCRQARF